MWVLAAPAHWMFEPVCWLVFAHQRNGMLLASSNSRVVAVFAASIRRTFQPENGGRPGVEAAFCHNGQDIISERDHLPDDAASRIPSPRRYTTTHHPAPRTASTLLCTRPHRRGLESLESSVRRRYPSKLHTESTRLRPDVANTLSNARGHLSACPEAPQVRTHTKGDRDETHARSNAAGFGRGGSWAGELSHRAVIPFV